MLSLRHVCSHVCTGVAVVLVAILTIVTAYIPTTSHAEEKTPVSVVFLSGLCGGKVGTIPCYAAQNANSNIGNKLPPGSKLIAPEIKDGLEQGRFVSSAGINKLLQDIGKTKTILIAYSAANDAGKALIQVVRAMTIDQIKQIESIVSLEGNYSGFRDAVALVRTYNPNVKVYQINQKDVNAANHASIPGAPGTSQAVNALVTAAQNGTTPDLPTQFASAPYSDALSGAFKQAGSQPFSFASIPSSASGNMFTTPSAPSVPSYSSAVYTPAIQQSGINSTQTSYVPAVNTNTSPLVMQTVQMTPVSIDTSSGDSTNDTRVAPPPPGYSTSTRPGSPTSTPKGKKSPQAQTFEDATAVPVATVAEDSSEPSSITDALTSILTSMASILDKIQDLFAR